ncbi:hypothetical protein EC973_003107 [Apophysomyces ossiformis]|uniref:histidine kinase n=1 Tax=Apophysomyces ossiformis TaxID=679940 RepID=A0A8H7EM74_9FUNG|nr:hypothetical protein EC973_003107 [Apophysomyces ossiformis]
MSNSGSSGSITDSAGFRMVGNLLQIPGYHFKATPTPSLAHGENVDIVYGYRILNKKPVIAKVSPASLRLEREFHIMQRLHQQPDGSLFLVQPLEYVNLPSGLTVAVYSDEGHVYLNRRRSSEDISRSNGHGISSSSTAGSSHGGSNSSNGTNSNHGVADTYDQLLKDARQRYSLHVHSEAGETRSGFSNPVSAYDLGTFLRFAIKCTDCLEFIHRHNVVHGEIRLSAFQWAGDDASRVKLWNFGSSTRSLETYLTSEGWRKTVNNKVTMDMLKNLLVYMSPEQTGRTTYVPDHRSDIYSLGVVFFVLLTGRNPFEGGPLEILNGILSKKLPLVSEIQLDVPDMVARIIEKMVAKSPDDRYSSAYGVKADLKECFRQLTDMNETSSESLSPFPLAQHDIASVFTLPNQIYGRQNIIAEMTSIIQNVAAVYKSSIQRRHNTHYATSAVLSEYRTNSSSIADSVSEVSGVDSASELEGRSAASPSYCSGLDGSEESIANNRVISPKKQGVEIVAVYGPGGIGKSTLLGAVQNLARQNGYVATAKFDARQKVPYGCILRSLSQILQQILSESEEEIDLFYAHLKECLGSQFCNIELLADLVPELKPLLEMPESQCNERAEAIHLDNVETRCRFHTLFVEVFRALSHWRMVTLFLDDLQEADEPSLELIQSLIISRVKVLLLVSYRDQEIFEKISDILNNESANIYFMEVQALSFESLVDYISAALHRNQGEDRAAILPLAEIVYKKTLGNAFYVAQVLVTLEKKKLIFFNWEKNEWGYNLRDIQRGLAPANEDEGQCLDIRFIVSRLHELPMDGQRLLKWASFVGDTFSWSAVKSLMLNSDTESDISSNGSNSDRCEEETVGQALQPLSKLSQGLFVRKKDRKNNGETKMKVKDPINGLQAALQEGYIVPLESDEFKWSHDRYSQAAMELADPKTRARIHLRIAEYLMNEEESDNSFLVADHLLKCMELVFESEKQRAYQSALIEAGNKARSSGAHAMAFAYYEGAIQLAKEDDWFEQTYEKSHHLFTNAVALSFVVGEYTRTESLLGEIFRHTKDPLDRVTAYKVQFRYYLVRQMHQEAHEALYRCLEEFDINLTRHITAEEVDQEFLEVCDRIKGMGCEAVRRVAACDDVRLRAIMSVLEELCTVNYWLGNQLEMFYLACRIVRLSLAKGLYAVERFQMYCFGEQLGATGLAIGDAYGTNNEKGRCHFLYTAFLLMWKYHLKEAHPRYRSALDMNVSAGDRIYATYSQVHIVLSMFFCGDNLGDVLHAAQRCYDEIHSWSSSVDTLMLTMCVIRAIKALQNYSFSRIPEAIFDGDDGFNDANFVMESSKQSSNPQLLFYWYESYRMIPLVLYGHYDYAIKVGYTCLEGVNSHPSQRHSRVALALHSLAILEKLRMDPVTDEERKTLMEQVHTNQELIRPWKEHSPVNYTQWYTLVEAEIASLGSDIVKAGRLYEDAINSAREGQWRFELALIHERAGAFYDRAGMRNVAYGFMRKAIELFHNHGSYGIARHLSVKFEELLRLYNDDQKETNDAGVQTDPFPFLNPHSTWSTSSLGRPSAINEPYTSESIPPVTTEQTLVTLDILDMASILKSSQVMSSVVKFDGLLKSMISIILENSGADFVAVAIKEDKYRIAAMGSQQEGTMTFDPPRTLSEDDELVSSRIINHTIHTVESIFIHNVAHDTRFAIGPWFERAGNKSVICMPISHSNMVVGCLFIEGAPGIFTQRHITVLSLLCQQMGISISNAFLFKSLQRVTNSYSRMIETQKQALEDARASKEAAVRATRLREIFLANMSHEIRTPFSGFYGMISLLAETKLDQEQRDLVKTAKESCEMLLQIIDDLLNFSKLQAGKVSLDLSPVAVEDTIADVVEMLIVMAIQKRINVTYKVSANVPPVVLADGNRLRQIIVNLLGNAIKFTHTEGEISILCSLDEEGSMNCPDGQVQLLFQVIDTGIGISEDQRKILFVPFSQVDGSTTRKYGGTGLGLSICLQLVQLMSGSIDVSSVPGEGSNFHFTIKVSKVYNSTGQLMQPNWAEENKDLLNVLGPIKVLVAGKYPTTTEMIRELVPGKRVDGASSVDELSSRLEDNQYDVIILGLLLSNEFEDSTSWFEDLNQKSAKETAVIIMHYPSGSVREFQRSHWIEPVAHTLRRNNKVTRLAVPLRRLKLLRTIADLLEKDLPKPKVIKASDSNKLTDEERARFRKMHILVAEDNPVAQKLLYKQLTLLGFQVTCANNGLEAVEAWTKQAAGFFTMGFFDHHMPKCDGVEATKRIRRLEATSNEPAVPFPIVALTADVQESARKICKNAGMDGYLTKPLNQAVLMGALRTYCHSPSSEAS